LALHLQAAASNQRTLDLETLASTMDLGPLFSSMGDKELLLFASILIVLEILFWFFGLDLKSTEELDIEVDLSEYESHDQLFIHLSLDSFFPIGIPDFCFSLAK